MPCTVQVTNKVLYTDTIPRVYNLLETIKTQDLSTRVQRRFHCMENLTWALIGEGGDISGWGVSGTKAKRWELAGYVRKTEGEN